MLNSSLRSKALLSCQKKRKSNHFITRALAREKNFLQKLLHPKRRLLLKTEC